jgi:hypothetical protein
MVGFLIRISTSHGEVVSEGTVPIRASYSRELPIVQSRIVNDPNNDTVRDLVYASTDVLNRPGGDSDYTLDRLIEDFQDEYECKVAYDDPMQLNGFQVFEFNVFEPSWETVDEAKDVIDVLMDRLIDWIEGYPQGR